MSSFAPAPPPPSKLGVYRTLSPLAGVHVSPIQLGAASIGDKWNASWEEMSKESSFALLDAKSPTVPIVGGRKVGHLLSNLEALDISLSQEHIDYLESVTPLDPGFPNSLMGDGTTHSFFLSSAANVEKPLWLEPIRPAKK